MGRRTAGLALAALLTVVPVPAHADAEHAITGTCAGYYTGTAPDSNVVTLRVVATSTTTGHPGLVLSEVECTIWTAREYVQARASSAARDNVAVGAGALQNLTYSRCLRAFATWKTNHDPTTMVDPDDPLHIDIDVTDDHVAVYSDPGGCLPPCHVVPTPSHCPATTPRSQP